MRIAIIGVGKLGYPMALFLSTKHSINAYDKNNEIIKKISIEKNYFKNENNLDRYLKQKKKIRFFNKISEALYNTSACFITVPTPSLKNGSFSNKIILNCLNYISKSINLRKKKLKPYLINICSTVSPGSCEKEFINFLKKKKLTLNKDYVITYNPYFVALGSVLKNLEKPDYILIGTSNNSAGKILKNIYSRLYKKNIKILLLSLEEAEIVKIFTNSFLTLKISFGNVLKQLATKKKLALNKILYALGQDERIGQKFLNPGIPFGGPCLPRDNYAVINYLKKTNLSINLSKSIIEINDFSLKSIFNEIINLKNLNFKKIGFLGAGYRPNTEYTEDSVAIKIINYCLKKKIKVFLFDYYTNYRNNKVFKCQKIVNLIKSSEIILLPFYDKKFQKILNFSHNKFIWDPFYCLKSKKHLIIRNCFEVKAK